MEIDPGLDPIPGRTLDREAAEKIADLAAALREAMATIKVFHGPVAWDIYERNAPEMKRWRALIAKANL